LLKNPECKKYTEYSENFQGKLCFSGQTQSRSKILNGEKIFNTVKNFQSNSVFQGKRKFLKIPE